MEFKKLSKNALKCRYVGSIITTVIELIVLAIIIYFARNAEYVWINIALVLIGIVIVVIGAVKPYFSHINYKYYINDEFIEIQKGKVFRDRIIVPIERLHKIEVSQGPVEKIFGVAELTVVSGGGEEELEYIDVDYANEVAMILGKRINEVTIKKRDKK